MEEEFHSLRNYARRKFYFTQSFLSEILPTTFIFGKASNKLCFIVFGKVPFL